MRNFTTNSESLKRVEERRYHSHSRWTNRIIVIIGSIHEAYQLDKSQATKKEVSFVSLRLELSCARLRLGGAIILTFEEIPYLLDFKYGAIVSSISLASTKYFSPILLANLMSMVS